MKYEEPGRSDLSTSLILVTSVILTVLVALFLALSDGIQIRLPAPVRPTIIVQNVGPPAATDLPPASSTPSPTPTLTHTPTNSPTPSPAETAGPTPTATPTLISLIAEVSCNNAPADWVPVIVAPGETLYMLSARYGATVGEIIQANCLESTTIFSGTILYLPASYPTRLPCGPPRWWITYKVRKGETLYLLALRHRTTVYAIMQANCMTDSQIFAGRYLYLPPLPATVPPPTIITATPTPSATFTPTPSATATETPDVTLTITPSPTSPVPTNTPTLTNTPEPTPSETPSPSPTMTPSPTAIIIQTVVNTPTPPLPPTATPTVPAPTNTTIPTPTATATPTSTPHPAAPFDP